MRDRDIEGSTKETKLTEIYIHRHMDYAVPFMYRISPNLYEIHFENFCITIRADDNMNILTYDMVVIF